MGKDGPLRVFTKAEQEAHDRVRARAERKRQREQAWYDYLHKSTVADLAAKLLSGPGAITVDGAVEIAKIILAKSGVEGPYQVPETHDDDLICC